MRFIVLTYTVLSGAFELGIDSVASIVLVNFSL